MTRYLSIQGTSPNRPESAGRVNSNSGVDHDQTQANSRPLSSGSGDHSSSLLAFSTHVGRRRSGSAVSTRALREVDDLTPRTHTELEPNRDSQSLSGSDFFIIFGLPLLAAILVALVGWYFTIFPPMSGYSSHGYDYLSWGILKHWTWGAALLFLAGLRLFFWKDMIKAVRFFQRCRGYEDGPLPVIRSLED